MKLESKIGRIEAPDEKIYNFLSNFKNFQQLIPVDKVKNWKSDENSCSFEIDYIGETGAKIMEKEPHSLIKYTNIDGSKYNFFFWIQLKRFDINDTRIKLTMETKLNPMVEMMAKKPLQDFLEKVVDQLVNYKF
jgi:carbon monoxide dehydrogenase subunit G